MLETDQKSLITNSKTALMMTDDVGFTTDDMRIRRVFALIGPTFGQR